MEDYTKVVKLPAHLGDLPYFSEKKEGKERLITFHQEHVVDNFPRVLSLTRILDALEINLFLEHRYKGKFMPPQRGANTNRLAGVSLLTLNSIANSLTVFLHWIETNDLDWHDVYAESASEKAKFWLPIYRYRKYLIDRVVDHDIDRDTANLYVNHVRQLYEWAHYNSRINKLPFKYTKKVIKKRRMDGDFDLLFSSYSSPERGIVVTTTDLIIPKKYKQKRSPKSDLSPYSEDELKALFSTGCLENHGARLRVELAVNCGLRVDEVTNFLADNVLDPAVQNKPFYYVSIVGKNQKKREIIIPETMMNSLWIYKNSKEHQSRLAKRLYKYGNSNYVALFLGPSGDVMSRKSIGNIISIARAELKEKGISLNRTFHDLRATFATNLACYLMSKNLPITYIQYKLMQLLGHNDFSTTQKYINFAQGLTFDKQMSGWVDQIYGDFSKQLQKEVFASEKREQPND